MSLIRPETRELASRIYSDLLTKHLEVKADAVSLVPGADILATLSFKLAAAFMQVEEDLNNANVPKKGFTLDVTDIAGWSK
jgi:hypothetical protein